MSFKAKMSLIIVVSSEDGKGLFTDNKPYDFRVKLNQRIRLDHNWVIAITEFTSSERIDSHKNPELFIFSDICQNSFIGNNEHPLLRRTYFDNAKQRNVIYNTPYYIQVRQGEIQQIHFYIKDDKGQDASFLQEKVTITLHLKKRSPCS